MRETLNLYGDTVDCPKSNQSVLCAYQAPASQLQCNMHFLDRFIDEPSLCVNAIHFRLYGQLNQQALTKAVVAICQKFDILRTVYVYQRGQLQQVVEAYQQHKLPVVFESIDAFQMTTRLRTEINQGFNLACEWPIRVGVFCSSLEQVLSITVHQIAVDDYSLTLLTRALSEAYQLFCRDINADISTLDGEVFSGAQYMDFGIWQQDYLHSDSCKQERQYWAGLLKNAPSCHNFPLEFSRPLQLSFAGDELEYSIGAHCFARLQQTAQVKQTSVFLLLQSLFAGFMARYGDEDDLIIGSVYGNRELESFKQSVGLFANIVPFRYLFDSDTDIDYLIDSTKAQHKQALRYQQLSLDMMLEGLNIVRDLSFNPLIQIQFIEKNDLSESLILDNIEAEQVNYGQTFAKYDLAVYVCVMADEIKLTWQFNRQLFSRGWMSEVLSDFVEFIEHHVVNSVDKVLNYPFKRLLLRHQNNREIKAHFAPYVSCFERIERYAVSRCDAIAVHQTPFSLSYAELIAKANLLIAAMQQTGLVKGDRVAVYMQSSLEQVIVMYALMRAGFVYVPIEPSSGRQHAAYVCQNAKVKGLLCISNERPCETIVADIPVWIYEVLIGCGHEPHLQKLEANDEACVIYMPNAEQQPQGVVLSHGSIYYALQVNRQVFEFRRQDVMPTTSPLGASLSLVESIVPLLSGGTVEVLVKQQMTDLASLIASTQRVSVMHMLPSMMTAWLEALSDNERLYPNLRLLLIGGEPVSSSLFARLKQWRTDIMVRAVYELPECGIASSYLSHEHDIQGYGLGKPHPNIDFYILNRCGQLQPDGVAGELYVGGLSLATGYESLAQLTTERFIDHPQLRQRLFKTGDRARLLPSGQFEFLACSSNQLKLGGWRLSAGLIESLTSQIEGIKQCVVSMAELGQMGTQLVLYYTKLNSQIDTITVEQTVNAQLFAVLPKWMRPRILVGIDRFIYKKNGKIDYAQLPQPNYATDFDKPCSDTERYLQQLWCKLLLIKHVSVTADFFALGGHSLLAVKMLNQINDDFAINLPLKQLFTATNIRDCAALIDEKVEYRKLCRLLDIDSQVGVDV